MKSLLPILNQRRSLITILILASVSFLVSSCSTKKPAVGHEDEIIVFADSAEYYNIESSMLTVFSKVILTPQPENLFNLTRKNLSELGKYKDRKNIIIVAPLNSNSDVSNYINSLLDQKVKDLVNKDSVFVVNKKDLWANGQLVMVLTAPDMEKLNKDILEDSQNLLHYFQKASDDRMLQSLYNERYENKKVEAQLLKKYGWVIYAEIDYFLARSDSANNFVWLRRSPGSEMERWIFVHWIDNASPIYLNRDSVYAIRNRVTKKFYRTDSDSSYVEITNAPGYEMKTNEVNFLKRYALFSQGLWRMSDGSMGGPFVNYTFYDEPTKRLYMLDGSIYAPKFYKKKLIQQVDVLLHSFLAERELSPDKKEDLLEELK